MIIIIIDGRRLFLQHMYTGGVRYLVAQISISFYNLFYVPKKTQEASTARPCTKWSVVEMWCVRRWNAAVPRREANCTGICSTPIGLSRIDYHGLSYSWIISHRSSFMNYYGLSFMNRF